MGIFGDKEQKKKEKALHETLSGVRKNMLSSGCNKGKVTAQLKTLEETLIAADISQSEYARARGIIESAIARIDRMLEEMGELAIETEKEELKQLTRELEQVYHDCLIRADDADYRSTSRTIKNLAMNYCRLREGKTTTETGGKPAKNSRGKSADMQAEEVPVDAGQVAVMLRSELENVRSVLSDAYGFKAPDFIALSYYMRREDKSTIIDMENEQRNAHVQAYFRQQFMQELDADFENCGEAEHMHEVMKEYVYG